MEKVQNSRELKCKMRQDSCASGRQDLLLNCRNCFKVVDSDFKERMGWDAKKTMQHLK